MDYQPTKIQMFLSTYLAHLFKIRRSSNLSADDTGFSLLEALVGVAVVSIVIVAIAPMVALSTSARINARRVDQATQAARSYIDAVRGGGINAGVFPNIIVASAPNAQFQYTFESINPPITTNISASTTSCAQVTQAVFGVATVKGACVDTNGNGFNVGDPQDLFVQPMRSGPTQSDPNFSDLNNRGFWFAVRVYRSDALTNGLTLKTGNEPECVRNKLAFANTTSRLCPLVTMRAQILPTINNNLESIKQGIGN
ncbi:hypothetical protein H6F42_11400 [Pseudanabaena sp. FACHB-1998]|uniref:hypothetical protein n=1 Tax=Pseudanabaena sp. FACHB-1998 TaxID=2692858 RepID=UPI0016811167|nr:hypothetical protein [Pseudanabaena sp. FACHB-1998]MBD2177518.1 hypothetical protein [Pseudanabaena sp. FACHB-1998]